MSKIPYDLIAAEVDKLIQKMVQAPDLETMNEYWEMYQALIKSSGWDETSFDTEMLKRIDKDWEEWEKKKSIPPPASKLN